MPIPAYDIDYLEAAQEDMGALFDVAINVLKFPYAEFQKLFLNNELSERFGKGDSFVIWGKSGKSFNEILSKLSFESIVHLYFPYHEMDILHFCDYMDKIFLDDKSIKVVN